MENFKLVKYHVLSAIKAAMAEADGYAEEAEKLRAQGNLRLLLMSEEELQELARMLSFLPSRSTEDVYKEIQRAIADQKAVAFEWVGSFGVKPFEVISQEYN